MATALEQFLSSASQPIEDPLSSLVSGLSGGAKLGFDLARAKAEGELRRKEIELKDAEIQSQYLSKGLSALTSLSKIKNSRQRKLMSDVTISYFSNAGILGDESKVDNLRALLNEPATTETIVNALKAKGFDGTPVIAQAEILALTGMDFEQQMEKIAEFNAKLAEAKTRGAEQARIEGLRQTGRMDVATQQADAAERRLALSQLNDLVKSKKAPLELVRRLQFNPDGSMRDVRDQVGALQAYELAFGSQLQDWRQAIARGIPGANKNDIADFTRYAQEVERSFGVDNQKAQDSMQQAESVFNRIRGVAKPTKPTAQKSSTLIKDLGAIREQAQKNIKDERTVARSLDTILKFADRPGPLAADLLVGSMDAIRSGKLNVLREGDMDRALAGQGIYDKVDVFLKKYTGKTDPKLGPQIRKEYKEIAEAYKAVVVQQIVDSYSPYLEQARGIGASEDQIKKIVVDKSLHKYLFPELQKKAAEQATPFFPTPTGAPVGAKSSGKKPLPRKEVLDAFKKGLKPGVNLKSALDASGYDTSNLKE